MAFALKPRQKVLFIGDSITDCGRRAAERPLGAGYVKFIADLVDAKYPDLDLHLINTGIGGHTVRDLRDRWTDDCVRHQPHWLSVKIGINDIHTWLRQTPERAVPPEQFAELYDHILARARKETRAQFVLVDPFYISRDTDPHSFRHEVLKHLPSYLRTVAALAKKYKARHVKLHDMFQRQLRRRTPDHFCPEPVHPYPTGHLHMALEWLRVMGW